MAITTLPSALEVKLWAKKDFLDVYKMSSFGLMREMGAVMLAEELNNASAGDQITVAQTGILTGQGKGEGQTLVNNEEALSFSSDVMTINEFRHAVLVPNKGTIQQQRSYINYYDRARESLRDFFVARYDSSLFNQLAGNTATTLVADTTTYTGSARTLILGNNTATAPTSNRVVRPGTAANDQSLTSSDTFTLDLVDDALVLAQTTYPTIKPFDGGRFALFISPGQFRQLKRDAGSAIQYTQIGLAMMTGGKIDGNMILSANGFMQKPVATYQSVDIYVSYRVADGVRSDTSARISSVKRAVLVGKNAIAFASPFAGGLIDGGQFEGSGSVPMEYKVEAKDYEHDIGVAVTSIFGMKKLVLSSAGFTEDKGVIVIATYAAN